jgi:hypothetical protein
VNFPYGSALIGNVWAFSLANVTMDEFLLYSLLELDIVEELRCAAIPLEAHRTNGCRRMVVVETSNEAFWVDDCRLLTGRRSRTDRFSAKFLCFSVHMKIDASPGQGSTKLSDDGGGPHHGLAILSTPRRPPLNGLTSTSALRT